MKIDKDGFHIAGQILESIMLCCFYEISLKKWICPVLQHDKDYTKSREKELNRKKGLRIFRDILYIKWTY